jgi:hypothetical protein
VYNEDPRPSELTEKLVEFREGSLAECELGSRGMELRHQRSWVQFR